MSSSQDEKVLSRIRYKADEYVQIFSINFRIFLRHFIRMVKQSDLHDTKTVDPDRRVFPAEYWNSEHHAAGNLVALLKLHPHHFEVTEIELCQQRGVSNPHEVLLVTVVCREEGEMGGYATMDRNRRDATVTSPRRRFLSRLSLSTSDLPTISAQSSQSSIDSSSSSSSSGDRAAGDKVVLARNIDVLKKRIGVYSVKRTCTLPFGSQENTFLKLALIGDCIAKAYPRYEIIGKQCFWFARLSIALFAQLVGGEIDRKSKGKRPIGPSMFNLILGDVLGSWNVNACKEEIETTYRQRLQGVLEDRAKSFNQHEVQEELKRKEQENEEIKRREEQALREREEARKREEEATRLAEEAKRLAEEAKRLAEEANAQNKELQEELKRKDLASKGALEMIAKLQRELALQASGSKS